MVTCSACGKWVPEDTEHVCAVGFAGLRSWINSETSATSGVLTSDVLQDALDQVLYGLFWRDAQDIRAL